MKCVTCERPGRHARDRKEDHPGTVLLVARGRCSTCYDLFRGKSQKGISRSRVSATPPDISDIPCVLVRVELTPATYKALRAAKADISSLLSRAADHIVAPRSSRA